MSEDDNKTRSITMLVRSLLAATVLIVVLAIALAYYLYSAAVVHIADQPKPFVCGTCEDLKRKRQNAPDYNANFNGRDGRSLFKANCSACHTLTDRNMTGPGLQGVLGRIPGGGWIYDWVHHSDSLIAKGDAYAVVIDEKFPSRCMHFPKLTNEEIDAMLGYASVISDP
jgi:cytochrome c2